jgi:peptidoglycan hydrolase CwlO-like protein
MMMGMAEVSLSQALKAKSRLAKQIKDQWAIVVKFNSVIEGTERPASMTTTYQEIRANQEKLAALKAAIQAANTPITETLYRMGELRGTLAMFGALTTTHGKAPFAYGMEMPTYDAELKSQWVMEETARLQAELDRLQDEVDAFNASTRLSIPD